MATAGERKGIFYGWIVLAAAVVALASAYYVMSSFAVYLKPLIEAFGWTRAQTTLAFSIFVAVEGTTALCIGLMTDRYGPRVTVSIGGLFMGLGLLLSSFITQLWHYYLFFGLFAGIGMGSAFPALTSTVSRWFLTRRGLALGILLAGMSLGQVIAPSLSHFFISSFGWANSFRITAVMMWVLILGAALFLRRDPRDVGLLPLGMAPAVAAAANPGEATVVHTEVRGLTVREAMRTRSLWALLFGFSLWQFAVFMPMAHFVAYATDVGVAAGLAAFTFGLIRGLDGGGRLVFGWLTDRIGERGILFGCYLAQVAAMAWLGNISTTAVFFLFALVYGPTYGGCATVVTKLPSRIFGIKSIGGILGLVLLFAAIGAAPGSWLAGYVFDRLGSYTFAFYMGAIAATVAAGLTLFIKTPKRAGEAG